jgi:NADPH:quinone reductase
LTSYVGDSSLLGAKELQAIIDAVEAGQAKIPLDKVYNMDQISEAHQYMDDGHAKGKLVVLTGK